MIYDVMRGSGQVCRGGVCVCMCVYADSDDDSDDGDDAICPQVYCWAIITTMMISSSPAERVWAAGKGNGCRQEEYSIVSVE